MPVGVSTHRTGGPGMPEPLNYCTQCGYKVGPYAPSTGSQGGERSYWCSRCDREYPAPDLSLTGFLCAGCGEIVPLGLRYCGHCGTSAAAPAVPPPAVEPRPAAGVDLLREIVRVLSVIRDP